MAGSETISQTEGLSDELNVARGKESLPFAFADIPSRSGLETGNEPTTSLPRLSVFDTAGALEESDGDLSLRIQRDVNSNEFEAALFGGE